MNDDLANRLIASIEADRLMVLFGAGLSMAKPSRVPSAAQLARESAAKYLTVTGAAIPDEFDGNLEGLAKYFLSRNIFYSLFLKRLIQWEVFRHGSNPAHSAIADFLYCGAIEAAITTNFDYLIEDSVDALGDEDFQTSLDGDEARAVRPHKPLLKLHGCMIKDRDATLWAHNQLEGEHPQVRLVDRLDRSKLWLRGNLRDRDLIFIGFWSDWGYLNDILVEALRGVEPPLVLVVDPDDDETLARKAPGLWDLCHAGVVDFQRLRTSGADFMDQLRSHFSRQFLARVLAESRGACAAIGGVRADVQFAIPAHLTSRELYSIRCDVTGTPSRQLVKGHKRPDPSMYEAGAIHLLLQRRGAQLVGDRYQLPTGQLIRVVAGNHQTINRVRDLFRYDQPYSNEIVICADTYEDGDAPSNVAAGVEQESIVRSVASTRWLTLSSAQNEGLL